MTPKYPVDHPFAMFNTNRPLPVMQIQLEGSGQASVLSALERLVRATPAEVARHLNAEPRLVSKTLRTLHRKEIIEREMGDWHPNQRGATAFVYFVKERLQ